MFASIPGEVPRSRSLCTSDVVKIIFQNRLRLQSLIGVAVSLVLLLAEARAQLPGVDSRFCPPPAQFVPGGGGLMCVCPDGTPYGLGGSCSSPQPEQAPVGRIPHEQTGHVGHFGAIAFSPSDGAQGWSHDAPSWRAADDLAMRGCRSSGCSVVVRFNAACGAVAVSGNGAWAADTGSDSASARHNALAACNNYGGFNCQVLRWVCTSTWDGLEKVDCGSYTCGDGSKCGSGRKCLALDAVDCGNGRSCPAGSVCTRGGAECPTLAQIAAREAAEKQRKEEEAERRKREAEERRLAEQRRIEEKREAARLKEEQQRQEVLRRKEEQERRIAEKKRQEEEARQAVERKKQEEAERRAAAEEAKRVAAIEAKKKAESTAAANPSTASANSDVQKLLNDPTAATSGNYGRTVNGSIVDLRTGAVVATGGPTIQPASPAPPAQKATSSTSPSASITVAPPATSAPKQMPTSQPPSTPNAGNKASTASANSDVQKLLNDPTAATSGNYGRTVNGSIVDMRTGAVVATGGPTIQPASPAPPAQKATSSTTTSPSAPITVAPPGTSAPKQTPTSQPPSTPNAGNNASTASANSDVQKLLNDPTVPMAGNYGRTINGSIVDMRTGAVVATGGPTIQPASPAPSSVTPTGHSFTFAPTSFGTVQISDNGKIIATTTPQLAALQYGYRPQSSGTPASAGPTGATSLSSSAGATSNVGAVSQPVQSSNLWSTVQAAPRSAGAPSSSPSPSSVVSTFTGPSGAVAATPTAAKSVAASVGQGTLTAGTALAQFYQTNPVGQTLVSTLGGAGEDAGKIILPAYKNWFTGLGWVNEGVSAATLIQQKNYNGLLGNLVEFGGGKLASAAADQYLITLAGRTAIPGGILGGAVFTASFELSNAYIAPKVAPTIGNWLYNLDPAFWQGPQTPLPLPTSSWDPRSPNWSRQQTAPFLWPNR